MQFRNYSLPSYGVSGVIGLAALLWTALSPMSSSAQSRPKDNFYPPMCIQNSDDNAVNAKECRIPKTFPQFQINDRTAWNLPLVTCSYDQVEECRRIWVEQTNAHLESLRAQYGVNSYPGAFRATPGTPCSSPYGTDNVHWTQKSNEILFWSECPIERYDTRTGAIVPWAPNESPLDLTMLFACEAYETPNGTLHPDNTKGHTAFPPVCGAPVQRKAAGNSCPTCGNPITIAVANKFQEEIDYVGGGPAPLKIQRYYNSMPTLSRLKMGDNWRLSYDRSIEWDGRNYVSALRPDGKVFYFGKLSSGQWVSHGDVSDRLIEIFSGSTRTGWQLSNSQTNEIERYSESGALLSITTSSGLTTTLRYSDASTPPEIASKPGLLIRVEDPFGRALVLRYGAGSTLALITDPSQLTYTYTYDNGRLVSVGKPDGSARNYLYEESNNLAFATRPGLVTGILSENGTRFSTYRYSASGTAAETSHAGASNTYSVLSLSPVNIKDPLNTYRTYSTSWIQGVPRIIVAGEPCAPGTCSGTVNEVFGFDDNANVRSHTDKRGFTHLRTYNLSRNLEESRTRAVGRPELQYTKTEWHPTERVVKRVSEPKRRTTYKYHLESGISCAPATASPMLVCEKRLEATTDDSGLSEFNAALDTTVPARIWSWTYNAQGQTLTATDPRGSVTTYTYHPATTLVVTQGDLASITTPAPGAGQPAHITQFTEYDTAGRLKKMIDPNGLETTLTYWPRGWLKTRTVGSTGQGAETTTYDYDNVGQLKKVTQPDSSFVEYFYDAAHRLEKIQDAVGNSITYTLDNMGNRTGETYKDPAGTLARTLTREYDALNRLKFDKGGSTPQPVTEYGYDNLGNLKKITDPLGRVTDNDYDALNRLIKVTDPQTPTRGITEYGYDGQDNLTSVKDPNGNTTTYTFNGLGDRVRQVSPDTGTTTWTHDAAGNIATQTDARGVTATYTHDALNRVTQVVYSKAGSPSETHTWTYDTCPNGKGRLCSVTDTSGSTTWSYDIKGRITAKTQTVAAVGSTPARSFTVGYGYNPAGQLVTVTLPSGASLTHGYNGNGQLNAINATPSGSTALRTILANAGYEPFGPVAGWTWGNGAKAFFDFDLDGRLNQTETRRQDQSALFHKQIVWDVASRVTGLNDLTAHGHNRTYGYDAVDRLTSDTSGSNSQTFTYDKNGNRATQARVASGATTNTTYAVPGTSNRLSNVAVAGGATIGYGYDEVGNSTSVFGSLFTYDLANRMIRAFNGATIEYRINALGQRVLKATPTGALYFVYDEQGRLIGEYSPTATSVQREREHVWFGDRPVAVLR